MTLVNGTTPQGSGITILGFGANSTFGSGQKIAVQIDGAFVGVLRGAIGSFACGSGIVGGVVKLETKDAADFIGAVPGVGRLQPLECSSNGNEWSSATTLAWMPMESAEFELNYTLRDPNNLTAGDGTTSARAFRTTMTRRRRWAGSPWPMTSAMVCP